MEAKDDGSEAPLSPTSQAKQDDRKKILQLVMEFAMSENFEKDFEEFAVSHKSSFLKILIMDTDAEHPMEWHHTYMEYLRTFEGKIERFISSVGFEINDFYEECKVILEDNEEVSAETRFFLEALLATSEYETFILLMKGEMMQFMDELDIDTVHGPSDGNTDSNASSPKVSPSKLSSSGRLDSKGEEDIDFDNDNQPDTLSSSGRLDSKGVPIEAKEDK
jgi:hypothetical protein